jgi:hypothetical protein
LVKSWANRLRRPPDCYSHSAFTTTSLSESASYRDAILHPEWQHAMANEIAALEQFGTWDLVPSPSHVHPITCKWGSLERYKVVLLVVFSRSKGMIMIRLLLLLLI